MNSLREPAFQYLREHAYHVGKGDGLVKDKDSEEVKPTLKSILQTNTNQYIQICMTRTLNNNMSYLKEIAVHRLWEQLQADGPVSSTTHLSL